MVLPVATAYPTEVVAADLAFHMVAALIFLYRSATTFVWAHLGVGQDPIHVFRLARILGPPHDIHITSCRTMQLLAAPEAEGVATQTVHNIRKVAVTDSLDSILALSPIGTPLDILVVVCEAFTVPSLIFYQVLRIG